MDALRDAEWFPTWFQQPCTCGKRAGEDADARMTAAARKRGVILTSQSRPLRPADLERFDFIVGMDPKNLTAMRVRPPRLSACLLYTSPSPRD